MKYRITSFAYSLRQNCCLRICGKRIGTYWKYPRLSSRISLFAGIFSPWKDGSHWKSSKLHSEWCQISTLGSFSAIWFPGGLQCLNRIICTLNSINIRLLNEIWDRFLKISLQIIHRLVFFWNFNKVYTLIRQFMRIFDVNNLTIPIVASWILKL